MTKRLFLLLAVLLCCAGTMSAKKKYPQIQFERTSVDVGVFSQDDPVKTVEFVFHNVGEANLVINYVHTSCGCTVADYPKGAIPPGGKGVIKVTYDGTNKLPGKFRRYVQVFTNCKDDFTRIAILGEMSALPKELLKK